jgi:2-methylcitrate dehydratase PrpD
MSAVEDTRITQSLGQFIQELRYEHIPAAGVARAKASLLDAVGCCLAGSVTEEAEPVRRMAAADGGTPIAQVLGQSLRLPPAAAALVNATAGHAMDYDDSSPPMIGHPSVNLMSVLFALGERQGASGSDIVTAYVAGLEVGARLGRHLNPSHYAAGWHATATLGTLAAAAAAARLLGFDSNRARTTMGIAASSASGIRKNFGSMVKPLHAGFAARNGVIAALLAAEGHTADPDVLDGERGFIDVFGGAETPDLTGLHFGLDQPLEIMASGVGIKRYACCGCTHSALDALLALREEHRFDAASIASMTCTMNGLVPDILVHHRPASPAQAKFSMEYCLAVAAIDGDCGMDQFSEARVEETRVRSLLERVTTSVDPAIEYRNGVYPGLVTVNFRDGSSISRYADEAKGHPDQPLALSELRLKFMSCARRCVSEDRAAAAFESLAALETQANVRVLAKRLAD